MKKRIALLLTFVLVLSMALCACGAKKSPVVGTWKTEIDLVETINQKLDAIGLGEIVHLVSVNLPLVIEFREDGTGSMGVDAEAINATVNKLVADMTVDLEAYFTDLFSSMGLQVDLDAALATFGISMDDLATEAESLVQDILAEFTTEFNYKTEDGKLYMSEDLNSQIGDTYKTYELKGKTLTLDVGNDVTNDLLNEILYPMTLKRAK